MGNTIDKYERAMNKYGQSWDGRTKHVYMQKMSDMAKKESQIRDRVKTQASDRRDERTERVLHKIGYKPKNFKFYT